MSEIINGIIILVAFNLVGIICLFLWGLNAFKDDIWGVIDEQD